MTTIKALSLAIGIVFAASCSALAQQQQQPQQQPQQQQGNPAANSAASGGSGTHQSSQKTGSAANTQKVTHNQNGYRGAGGSMRGRHCHFIHRKGSRHLVKVCH